MSEQIPSQRESQILPITADWTCPHGNRFCGRPGWSKCGPCHDDMKTTNQSEDA